VAGDANRNIAEEIAAIKVVAEALQPLDDAARCHVIAYVSEALGIATTSTSPPDLVPGHERVAVEPVTTMNESTVLAGPPSDIRSLKEQKQPRSANEMAALVAYYVSELLPPDERRPVVTSSDIDKYFKQANYRLPGRVAQTLPDAARAGYFDVVDRGQYRLNPVGYNLVVHGLPSAGTDGTSRPSRSRKTAKKSTAKKATVKKAGSTTAKRAKTASTKRPAPKRS
jgi:hypothetical protein